MLADSTDSWDFNGEDIAMSDDSDSDDVYDCWTVIACLSLIHCHKMILIRMIVMMICRASLLNSLMNLMFLTLTQQLCCIY